MFNSAQKTVITSKATKTGITSRVFMWQVRVEC